MMYKSFDTDGIAVRYWLDPETRLLHRTNGPAVEYSDGDKLFFRAGQFIKAELQTPNTDVAFDNDVTYTIVESLPGMIFRRTYEKPGNRTR